MKTKLLALPALIIFIITLVPLHSRAEPVFNVVINEIQTGGSGTGTTSQEFIELYNPTDTDVDVTGWKVEYITASGATVKSLVTLQGVLMSNGFALLATPEFGGSADFLFGASLSGTAGHVRLLNAAGQVIDLVGWGAAIQAETSAVAAPHGGAAIVRKTDTNGQPIDTDDNSQDFIATDTPTPQGGSMYELVDVCINIDGVQLTVPVGYEIDSDGNCYESQPPIPYCASVELSEIMANPVGDDSGREYIEIHNPTDETISLVGCNLRVGSKAYALVGSLVPGGYKALYSTQTALQLTNTGGTVVLVLSTGEQAVSYPALGDDETWASINGRWQLSSIATPDAANKVSTNVEIVGSTEPSTAQVEPCPAGKFRNPLTNRCKNIASATGKRTPCKPGQTRNPDTNRCRNIALTAALLTPCKVGYERNMATNRCRKIGATTNELTPCKEGQTRSPDTNRCRKTIQKAVLADSSDQPASKSTNLRIIFIVGALVIGYALYEYRKEFVGVALKFRKRFGRPGRQ